MTTTPATRPTSSARVLLRVEDAAARLSIGRTSMFALIKSGAIESVRVGRLRRIPAEALTHYVNQLASEQRARVA